jgi:hypothetical protein
MMDTSVSEGGRAHEAWCARTSCSASTMNAGPVTKADARKRGASSAVFQNGRPPRPQ